VRLRYRRVTAAGSAALVTLVAVLGATGIVPAGESAVPSAAASSQVEAGLSLSGFALGSLPRHPEFRAGHVSARQTGRPAAPTLPEDSGEGRRIVFDMSDQRVWLVSPRDRVRRTYLVSGSLTDNLEAGSYAVYSKSLDAIGIDDSGTMRYMVRFAHGDRAAIGFHDIPVHRGEKVQTLAELGTPQSHGCIRQRRVDARALWDFAPVGTRVVVTA
jgi:lipoprotein-anchoring transpeptidase ErfK/SrfK